MPTCLLCLLAEVASAGSSTLVVPGDHPTIAQAVSAASDGDTIVIAGEITETVPVDRDLVFEGDPTEPGVWSAESQFALSVTGFAEVTLRDLTLVGAKGARGLQITNGTVRVDGCTFRDGDVGDEGGAIRGEGTVTLEVRSSEFVGNRAAEGGHVWVAGGEGAVFDDVLFVEGTATGRGGALVVSALNTGAVEITASRFERNTAGTEAGAVVLDDLPSAVVQGSFFCENTAAKGAGGALQSTGSTLAVAIGNVFELNTAELDGGAIHAPAAAGSLSTSNNHFVDNVSRNGRGAAIFTELTGEHVNGVFVGNETSEQASAAFVGGGLSLIDYALFFENSRYDTTSFVENQLRQSPRLRSYPKGSPCDIQRLAPQVPDSPLFDAGDPARTDVDGTRSDLGAFGGSQPFPADLDGDGTPLPEDCNDYDDEAFPGAAERCNGLDDDCDGQPLSGEADADADGFRGCEGDCDDDDAKVFPGAPERPVDGIDQDCDGGDQCFVDADGDGHGGPSFVPGTTLDCSGPGEAPLADDCDDTDPDVAPSADEVACNGVDDDCRGATPDCPEEPAPAPSGCGCTAPQAPAGLPLVLWVALLIFRRRDSPPHGART